MNIKDEQPTNAFIVRCEATQDRTELVTGSPENALEVYLLGYRTEGPDGDPIPEGVKYSTLTVWRGDDCLLSCEVFADGVGGWVQGART